MITQQNWRQLSSIQIGGAICLPVIMVGQTLVRTYGFWSGILGVLFGNTVLLLLGLISSKMSVEKQKTTVENATDYFGAKGIRCFAVTMILSMIAWFGIQLNMMSLGALDLLSISPSKAIYVNIFLGLLITFVMQYGVRGINLLADLCVPLLLLTLVYAWCTQEKPASSLAPPPITLAGSSIVIAMAIAVVIDLPTYFRHAKTKKDGYISMLIVFGFAMPFLEIVGIYLAAGSCGNTILDVFKRENGHLWNFWIALFLVLAGWTTNNLNLYSGAICLDTLVKNWSENKRIMLVGCLGTLLSCFDLLKHFDIVLEIMGSLITSMGAVVLSRYLMDQLGWTKSTSAEDRIWHLGAWILGMAGGFLSIANLSFTSIAVLDSAIFASLGTFLILVRKETHEKVNLRSSG